MGKMHTRCAPQRDDVGADALDDVLLRLTRVDSVQPAVELGARRAGDDELVSLAPASHHPY